jgi:hypothetical protein
VCPAVDAGCDGLVESGAARPHLLSSTRRLGEQRSQIGTHLHEARGDLDIALQLLRVVGRRRIELLDAPTIGWAAFGVERLAAMPVLDARADLAALSYLRLRVRYREATYADSDVAARHLLVVAGDRTQRAAGRRDPAHHTPLGSGVRVRGRQPLPREVGDLSLTLLGVLD